MAFKIEQDETTLKMNQQITESLTEMYNLGVVHGGKLCDPLLREIEQLILHAEEGTLDYSVLEHARKLVFCYSGIGDGVTKMVKK